MNDGARFCHNCGQNTKDKKINIRALMSDFLNNFFSLDFIFFKTLKALFIPGKLTEEYFKGRHASYLSPWRLFFISIVFMLLSVSISKYFNKDIKHKDKKTMYIYFDKDKINFEIDDKGKMNLSGKFDDSGSLVNGVKPIAGEDNKNDVLQNGKSIHTDRKFLNKLPDSILADKIDNIYIALDTAFEYSDKEMKFVLDSLHLYLDNILNEIYVDSIEFINNISVSKFDLKHLSFRQLLEKYDIDTKKIPAIKYFLYYLYYEMISKEFDEKEFTNFFINNINWFIIILLPFAALLFKLLYLRRKRFFVEHLVFNIYNHSAILFLIAFIEIILLFQIAIINMLTGIMLLFLPALYYIFAMRKYYRQSWSKTISKFIVFSFMYLFILSMALIIYSVIGAWLTVRG